MYITAYQEPVTVQSTAVQTPMTIQATAVQEPMATQATPAEASLPSSILTPPPTVPSPTPKRKKPPRIRFKNYLDDNELCFVLELLNDLNKEFVCVCVYYFFDLVSSLNILIRITVINKDNIRLF